MATTATGERLLTIEEYVQLPDNGMPTELVRGRVIPLNQPYPWHGYVCSKVNRLIGGFVEQQDRGCPMSCGVVTERDPDTVRGADFAYYSYTRVPKGTLPKRGYLSVAPDLVIEVRSPDDRWSEVLAEVAEYLKAGVSVVCVLDPQRNTATVYTPDQPEVTFTAEQTLSFPEVLPGFSVVVQRLFE
jgi:Uma2 family endonuclease